MALKLPIGRPRSHFATNSEAARATVAHLDASGGLKGEDAALVTYVLTTAAAVDAAPEKAMLRTEYREALLTLIKRCERDAGGLEEFLSGMRAEMGNAETRPTVVGPRSGSDREEAGTAVHALAASRRNGRPGTAA